MKPIQCILVPTDFSEASGEAAAYACDLARRIGASIELITVCEMPVNWAVGALGVFNEVCDHIRAGAAKQLGEFAEAHFTGVPLKRQVREGDPSREIIRAAADLGTDLIVMGTHGRTGVAHLLIGSVAEKVVRKSPIPVLTVRG